jgi:hypothetical protein
VSNKLSLVATHTCIGTTMLLTAYGANTYTWYPMNDHNQFVFVNPTGPTVYTLTGTSGTCSGSQTLEVDVCPGMEVHGLHGVEIGLFPNPFSTGLTVSNAYGLVTLINMTGQLLLEAGSEGNITLQTGHLPQGVYLVMLTDKNGRTSVAGKVIRE